VHIGLFAIIHILWALYNYINQIWNNYLGHHFHMLFFLQLFKLYAKCERINTTSNPIRKESILQSASLRTPTTINHIHTIVILPLSQKHIANCHPHIHTQVHRGIQWFNLTPLYIVAQKLNIYRSSRFGTKPGINLCGRSSQWLHQRISDICLIGIWQKGLENDQQLPL